MRRRASESARARDRARYVASPILSLSLSLPFSLSLSLSIHLFVLVSPSVYSFLSLSLSLVLYKSPSLGIRFDRECIGSCTVIVKGRAMRGGRARTEPSGGAPRSFMNGPPRLSHIWKRRVDRQPIPARRSSVYARVCAPYVFIHMRVYLYMPTYIYIYIVCICAHVFKYIRVYI